MKTISTLALLILFTFNSFSQKGSFKIMPYGGISIPLGKYRNTGTGEIMNDYMQLNGRGATNGYNYGLNVNYFISNKLSLSLDFNKTIHKHQANKKEKLYREAFKRQFKNSDLISFNSEQKYTGRYPPSIIFKSGINFTLVLD